MYRRITVFVLSIRMAILEQDIAIAWDNDLSLFGIFCNSRASIVYLALLEPFIMLRKWKIKSLLQVFLFGTSGCRSHKCSIFVIVLRRRFRDCIVSRLWYRYLHIISWKPQYLCDKRVEKYVWCCRAVLPVSVVLSTERISCVAYVTTWCFKS